MKILDFIRLAKKAQSTLKAFDLQADHIYLIGYSDPGVIPSLVFVSQKYNKLDLYHRAQLSTSIQKGPFKYNFNIVGTNQIGQTGSLISRDHLYKAIKLYGKKPLTIAGVEYASQQDMNFAGSTDDSVVI